VTDPLYPPIEPHAHGMLDVGSGDHVYWEVCGNPEGKPAVYLHGGPGSGCTPASRRFFDPSAYRIVLFDQRNCGRSRPHASDPVVDLASNTTANLVADIERLREHVDVDRWLVFGGSWASTLGLAYAEAHSQRVSELVLFGVTTGRHSEMNWLFRGGIAPLFPAEWESVLVLVPEGEDVLDAYVRMLSDPDPDTRHRAAHTWCLWESATPDWPPSTGLKKRFQDPDYAVAFARIVTHYTRNYAFLEDGVLLRNAHVLAETPGILVNGRFDFQAPLGNAWELKRMWSRAELVVVPDAGHGGSTALDAELVRATDRFARPPSS
jgi:proline iminopeptidase